MATPSYPETHRFNYRVVICRADLTHRTVFQHRSLEKEPLDYQYASSALAVDSLGRPTKGYAASEALAQIRDDTPAGGIAPIGVVARNPDFAALARACGASGALLRLPRSPWRCARRWLTRARRFSKWTRWTLASRERRGSPGALRLIPSRLTQPHRAAAGVRRHLPRVGAYLRRQSDPGACAAAADCGRHAFHAFSTVLLTLITRARGLALPARRRDWYAIAPTALLGVVLANGLGPIRLGMVRAPLSGWLAGSGRDESHGRC